MRRAYHSSFAPQKCARILRLLKTGQAAKYGAKMGPAVRGRPAILKFDTHTVLTIGSFRLCVR